MAGGLARDRAGDKMDKTLAKLDRRWQPQRNETLVEQVKRLYPDRWESVLDEMIKEADPDYRNRKEASRKKFWNDYFSEVPPYMRSEITQEAFVARKMTEWTRNAI